MTKTQKNENATRNYTAEDFAAWRNRMGYSVEDAAKQLGCAIQSVYNWERGESDMPRYIGLACDALALGINVIQLEDRP